MISFEISEEQQLIRDMIRSFAREELAPRARESDEAGEIPQEVLDAGWELGLINAMIPETCDGSRAERAAINSVILLEELGAGCASQATAIMAPSMFVQPLVDFGTQGQQLEYLCSFAGGDYCAGALGLHESQMTFDPAAMQTTASRDGDSWVLNGEKRLVAYGEQAAHMLIVARTGDAMGLDNVEAFIVRRDAPGVTIGAESGRQGLKPVPMARVALKNVRVDGANQLGGADGIDARVMMNSIRLGGAALALGTARAATEYAIPYACEREAFGEVIAKKQAIAFMLADMHSDIEAMRWMIWKAASIVDQGADATRATTLARNYVQRHALRVTDDALQVFGGHGFIRDLPLEMWMRNARTLTILEGPVAA